MPSADRVEEDVERTGRHTHRPDPQDRLAERLDARRDEDAVSAAHPADHRRGRDAAGRAEAGDGVRRDGRVAEQVELQGGQAGPESLAGDPVAAHPVDNALLQDQAGSLAERLDQVGRHRDRLVPSAALGDAAAPRGRYPVPLPAHEIVGERRGAAAPPLHGLERAGGDRDHREAEWHGQALLRAGHVDVDTPGVRLDVQPGQRRDRVQEVEGPVASGDVADEGGRVGGPGGRLVVDERDDSWTDLADRPIEALQVERSAELHRERGDDGARPLHDLLHERAEHPGHHDHDPVTRLDKRDRRRLQAGAAGAREGDHLPARLEDLAQIEARRLEHLLVERGLVLDDRTLGHGADDAPGHLGRTGNHEDRTV